MVEDIRRPLRVAILALLFIAAFGASSASFAQSPDQAKAFVRAAIAVGQVNEEWQRRINRAESEVEAERLREKAAIATRQAIREADDITVDEYRTMYHAARRDPELEAYLTDLFEQEVAAGSGFSR